MLGKLPIPSGFGFWEVELTETPPHPRGTYTTPSVMTSLGFTRKESEYPGTSRISWNPQAIDREVASLITMPYVRTHGVSIPNHHNCNLSVLKYDHTELPSIPLTEQVIQDTCMFFSEAAGKLPVVGLRDVDWVPTSSPGLVYKNKGCSTKKEAIEVYWEQIVQYHNAVPDVPPAYWSQCSKMELLKLKKLEAHDLRGFTIPPVDLHLSMSTHLQAVNKWIVGRGSHNDKWPIAIGMPIAQGGLLTVANMVSQNPYKFMGDATKYDSTLHSKFAVLYKRVRKYMTLDQHIDAMYDKRMDFYYNEVFHTIIVMPSWQVLMKDTGIPSGYVGTSYDGSISHIAIWCYAVRAETGVDLYTHIMQGNLVLKLFSDDNIGSIQASTPYPTLIHLLSYEVRKHYYGLFGVSLSKDSDLTGPTIDGMSFLGPVFHQEHGMTLKYSRDKILCSIVYGAPGASALVRKVRAIGLMYLTPFDHELYRQLRTVATHLASLAVDDKDPHFTDPDQWLINIWGTKPMQYIPTFEEVRATWLGDECLGLRAQDTPLNETCRNPNNQLAIAQLINKQTIPSHQ
jgi:hypothetical protein